MADLNTEPADTAPALPWPARPTSLALAAEEDCAAVDHVGRGRACLCCGAVTEEPWPNIEETDRG